MSAYERERRAAEAEETVRLAVTAAQRGGSPFTEAAVNVDQTGDPEAARRFRIHQLTVAARLIAEGHEVEPAWVRVQLLDLRDLLESLPGDE